MVVFVIAAIIVILTALIIIGLLLPDDPDEDPVLSGSPAPGSPVTADLRPSRQDIEERETVRNAAVSALRQGNQEGVIALLIQDDQEKYQAGNGISAEDMKMVAAAKLRKAQDAIVQLRPYADKLNEIQSGLSAALRDTEVENVFAARTKGNGKVLLVVITSNKGLCGAFNPNVIRETKRIMSEKYAEQVRKGDLEVVRTRNGLLPKLDLFVRRGNS